MSLRVDIGLRREAFELAVALEARPGEVVAVLGPNGAGKTTLLRAVAGLEALQRGTITVGGRPLTDVGAGIHLPPPERRVGLVFQDYLLFPHLTVAENVAFGRGAGGRAFEWMDRLRLGHLASRLPGDLSGGEAQRVALARALATDPEVLLLDEPLAALDVDTRQRVRTDLAHHLAAVDVPVLLVTHDRLDAALLADHLVILERGTITQSGSLTDITRRPRSPWTARLAGVNLYRGSASAGVVEIDGASLVAAERVDGPVFAVIPPHAVSLYRRPPAGSPRNVWQGTVSALEPAGSRIRVAVEGDLPVVAEVTPDAVEALELRQMGPVWVVVKATEIETYPS